MEFNQFNMYAYNAGISQAQKLDEVDECKQDLMRMTEYEDVKNFLQRKFGEFEGKKWVTYKELNKHVYLYKDDEKVEFCALKDNKQYWGRGWRLETVNEDKQQ